jgi:single-strand DNA-binding protein
MASFNKITIVGYLGRDPELRYTPDGTPVCNFSVATTERKKDKSGEFHDVTTWFRVVLWRRQAEVAGQYLAKGRQVYVEGRLTQTEYQDRDGVTRTTLEVQGTDVQFIGPREDDGGGGASRRERSSQSGSASSGPAGPGPASEDAAPVTEDDIPF